MTRTDALVLLLAAALLPVLYWQVWQPQGAPLEIEIRSAEGPPIRAPLAENRRFTLHGPLGDSMVEIRDGQVRFLSSPCQGKQCIHFGWLHSAGETAACLPNRVTVRVLGRDLRYDAVNF